MKPSSPRFWLHASLLFLPLTVASVRFAPGHLLDAGPLYVSAIPFGIALGAFHARFARHWKTIPAALPSWGTQLYFGFFHCILATLMFGTLFRGANIYFDQSPPQNLRLKVLNQHIASTNRGRSSTLQLILQDPLHKENHIPIAVSEEFYIAHKAGSSLAARLHRGALGAAWIEPLE